MVLPAMFLKFPAFGEWRGGTVTEPTGIDVQLHQSAVADRKT